MVGAPYGLSFWERTAARLRMPTAAAGFVALVAGLVFDLPSWWWWAATALFVLGMVLYFRLGTPHGAVVDLRAPVRGRWVAVNSPSTRVPSHFMHGWSQTYAIDLVFDQGDGSRPGMSWWPLARRPEEFPGFGRPVTAPVAGQVVRSWSSMRDHRSRTSPAAMLWLLLESVRELVGPIGVLGNHVVIRRDDGVCVLMAHLRRGSLTVRRGDPVEAGQVVAECGNSGNSTEPHVHVQAMDRASVWLAAGLSIHFDGVAPPRNGEVLALAVSELG